MAAEPGGEAVWIERTRHAEGVVVLGAALETRGWTATFCQGSLNIVKIA